MPTKFEKLITEIKELLPSPVSEENTNIDAELIVEDLDEGAWLIGGSPGEVAVFVSEEVVVFSQFAITWKNSPNVPTISPIPIASIHWKNLRKQERHQLFTALVEMIAKRRRKLYRACNYCKELVPPEWMHGDDICGSCAERHLGIIH